MNTVQDFINRQRGVGSSHRNYDIALSRLCVLRTDNWRGLIHTIGVDFEHSDLPPIYAAKFANTPNAHHLLALANEDGKIAIHDTENMPFDEKIARMRHQLPVYQCHNNAVCDIAWMPGEMKLVSASSDSNSCLWDVSEGDFVHVRNFSGHTRSVKTVVFREGGSSVFATGGRDGAILIWDTRVSPSVDHIPRADNCIFSGHAEYYESRVKKPPNACKSSITGLGFQDENTLISCGSGDGVVKVWDLRRNYTAYKKEPLPKYSLPYSGSTTFKGFTNLAVDPKRFRLYVNCMDNTIYCYNIATYNRKPLQRYVGFKNGSYYIRACLSPDGQYLISGSSDERAYIWNVDNPSPVAVLSGNNECDYRENHISLNEIEMSCVAWSHTPDLRIATCTDDGRHRIWRIGASDPDAPCRKSYRQWAFLHPNYGKKVKKSGKIEKTWWSNGGSTPSSSGRVPQKRAFAELDDDYGETDFSGAKRCHIEPRGRRLFPTTLTMHTSSENPPNELKSPIKSPTKSSPLSERVNVSLEIPSTSQVVAPLFSPTSNLPNYVVDGQAPHLRVISPKRKLKENVDWLTKIRKQKLQQVSTTLMMECDSGGENTSSSRPSSPRVQSLRDGELTSPHSGTPRRRTSRSSSTSDRPRTPNRHPSESILRFLTPTTSSSANSPGHK